MPFTADELTRAGHASLDAYLRNPPVDQIKQERPLLASLKKTSKAFPGGKQYVIENIRKTYNSNFGWFFGDAEVTYNKRDSVRQSQWPWRSAHDGFTLNEDELFQNGITVIEGKVAKHSEDEVNRLVDLLEENNAILTEGFDQTFDYELHRDGSQNGDSVAGLDYIIATAPTTGVVGGLDRSTETYWQNYASTGIVTTTAGTLIQACETAWRSCTRHGGQPDVILAGEAFIDAFRKDATATGQIQRFLSVVGKGSANKAAVVLDPSSDLAFHGVEIQRDPTALDLDTALAPAIPWQKRCYFINTKSIRLRPAQGHDMIARKPPRIYNRYAYYYGLTWKGALTCSRPNANAVLSIA